MKPETRYNEHDKKMQEIIEQDKERITLYQLKSAIEHYNKDHALQISLKINEVGFNVLSFRQAETMPMTNVEAFYFLKGFKYCRENELTTEEV